MHPAPIQPAQVSFNDSNEAFATLFGEPYPTPGHERAQRVFLQGNGLPQRWLGRSRFVVLETGFGLGNNFLATWDAWRQDPQRCEQLHFISVERHPLTLADLRTALRTSPFPPLAAQLADAWPPLTPNLHRLSFEDGRVQLLLAWGDIADWLGELLCSVDAFFLDGFAPDRNPSMWQPRLFKAMARLAAPGATMATLTTAPDVRAGLVSAGFELLDDSSPTDGNPSMTRARHAPPFVPKRAPARTNHAASTGHRALVIGGGLAGCAAAWALAEQGWHSAVFDHQAGPAQETSGNPAGLFHGIVNAQDGTHARFNRAASLEARRAVEAALAQDPAIGQVAGLLRLDTSGSQIADMQAVLAKVGLPIDYVQAVDAATTSALSGISLGHPAWFYPGGGWVQPAALARSFLDRAGQHATFHGGVHIDRLEHTENGWQLWSASGQLIAQAEVVVLANAMDALRLAPQAAWATERVRGQISMLPLHALHAMGITTPHVPVAGAGYLLPSVNGMAVFGATSQVGDDDPLVRSADHAHNLSQLARLTGAVFDAGLNEMEGRTGWRWVADDRLPLIGAVPDETRLAGSTRTLDQPRFVSRQEGLFVFGALGSRGITWAALGGQVLASWITGAPCPVEASLLDAIDPARFVCRAVRRAAR